MNSGRQTAGARRKRLLLTWAEAAVLAGRVSSLGQREIAQATWGKATLMSQGFTEMRRGTMSAGKDATRKVEVAHSHRTMTSSDAPLVKLSFKVSKHIPSKLESRRDKTM